MKMVEDIKKFIDESVGKYKDLQYSFRYENKEEWQIFVVCSLFKK